MRVGYCMVLGWGGQATNSIKYHLTMSNSSTILRCCVYIIIIWSSKVEWNLGKWYFFYFFFLFFFIFIFVIFFVSRNYASYFMNGFLFNVIFLRMCNNCGVGLVEKRWHLMFFFFVMATTALLPSNVSYLFFLVRRTTCKDLWTCGVVFLCVLKIDNNVTCITQEINDNKYNVKSKHCDS